MQRALVLGGYGLIGAACMRSLAAAGFEVVGLGRSHRAAMASNPRGRWIIRDITSLTDAEWSGLLSEADVVVNASGALQNGSRDNLEAIHTAAAARLAQAASALPVRVIQISAAGVSEDASTDFFRSKAHGDAAIAAQARDWGILRPALVLSPEAYGGTALLRAAAALPLMMPQVMPGSRIQTVDVQDVASAVTAAAQGKIPSGTIADLAEAGTQSLPELTEALRSWLGLPPPRFRPALPAPMLRFAGKAADLLGWLGWRSPLRSNALTALADGIRGDPAAWEQAGGQPCRPLADTLARMPATRQERLFARFYVLLPLAIATLSLFWCASGLITLLDPERAIEVLTTRGFPAVAASFTVFGGVLADTLLGIAILWRSRVRQAAAGMALLSGAYLAGSLAAAPDLWLDPLGPMVKVLPGIMLAILVWAVAEER